MGACPFPENGHVIGTDVLAPEEHRDGVPAVAPKLRRCGVVAGNDQHGWFQRQYPRDRGVYLLDDLDFGVEVPILAPAVGVLHVDEEEVIVAPMLLQCSDLVVPGFSCIQQIHSDQPRHTPIHGVDGYGGGFQFVDLLELGQIRVAGEPTQSDHVGRMFVLEDLPRFLDPGIDQFSGFPRFRGQRLRWQWCFANLLWVGVGDLRMEAFASEHQGKPVLFHRHHESLHAGQLDLAQFFCEACAFLGGNAAGPPIYDQPVLVDGAEISTCCHVVWPQWKADPHRLQCAAADLEFQWIVAKKGQVRRAAARRNAWSYWHMQPDHSLGRQSVQVRGIGRFQLSEAARFHWQPTQAVHYQQCDFLGVRYS